MRIISQDKKFDLPYGETTLQALGDGRVIAFSLSDLLSDAFMIMAKYSTEEKGIKAMEMCRKHYATAEYNRRIIPKGDTLVDMEIAKEFLASGFIFQFPADEEVEV